MRVILERFADPGGWTKDAEAELAERFDVSPHTIEVDACNVSNFLALFEELGGAKPFLIANLTSMVVAARRQGRIGEGAQAAQVLAKITGDIAAPSTTVNVHNIQAVEQVLADPNHETTKALREKQNHAYRDGVLGALDRVLALLGATDEQRRTAHDEFLPNAAALWKAGGTFEDDESWRDAKQWAQEQTRRLPEGSGER